MSSPGDSSASADSRSNLYHAEDGTQTPPTYEDDEAYARAVAASFEIERGPDAAAAAAAAAADEQFASMLQAQEISLAASTTPQEAEDNSPAFHVEDPVWGKFEREEPPGPHVVLCIATCPCCVPPFCSPERKEAYKTVAKTISFVLGVIQLIALIAMICVRGFAPTSINYMLGPWPGMCGPIHHIERGLTIKSHFFIDTLNMFGAKNLPEVVENYQLWRLLTPALLHAGIVHFLTNIVMQVRTPPFLFSTHQAFHLNVCAASIRGYACSQLRVGLHLEVLWGFRVYGAIYVGAAFASSIASMVFLPVRTASQ